jgi:hypothetical protein
MIKHCKFYTSVKSGVTMSRKGWLQLISKMDFGRELFLCMMNPCLLEAVAARFEEYKQNGIFVPAVKEAK